MKKWMIVVLVGILSGVLFLAVAQAQEAAPTPTTKKTASLENTLNCFSTFMSGVLDKIKANMDQIDQFNGKVNDLRDIVKAVSIEIKDAEGKMVGLRQDMGSLSKTQKAYGDRIAALEKQLSDLAATCDTVSKKAEVTKSDLATLKDAFNELNTDYQAFKQDIQAEIQAVQKSVADLNGRVKKLEDEDVGTFKKKVIELERTMSALSIKIDNNRTKLGGFDQAISGFASDIEANKKAILANKKLLEDHENRIAALEKSGTQLTDLKSQVNSLYFISIVALLAGVGALVWGFMK